jgi:type I restriction-modification system DNA methylase subunit
MTDRDQKQLGRTLWNIADQLRAAMKRNRLPALSRGSFPKSTSARKKLGRKYDDRNAKLCSVISEIARGRSLFSADVDTLGDACEYLIGQFAHQLSLAAWRGSERGCAVQEPRHRTEERGRLRVPVAWAAF